MQASALLLLARHSPKDTLCCPCCHKKFPGEDGKPYLTEYKRGQDAEYQLGYLLYCSWLCVTSINPPHGSC